MSERSGSLSTYRVAISFSSPAHTTFGVPSRLPAANSVWEPLLAALVQFSSQQNGDAESRGRQQPDPSRGLLMNNIIYIVGLVVVVLAILSFLGLR